MTKRSDLPNADLPKELLKSDEEAIYRLRALYGRYGYTRYKVSKFEQYDLYAKNKSFLVCENILTFTDTNGKLMALKPDVTLSIVKNFGAKGTGTSKLYYSETVYRTSARSEGFREIRQTGLECIGRIDRYLTGEVVMLAERSLAEMGDRYVLDLSHMGFLTGLLEECGVDGRDADEVLSLMANKNLHGLSAFAEAHGLSREAFSALSGVTSLYEPLGTALDSVRAFVRGERMQAAYDELVSLYGVLQSFGAASQVCLDFTLASDRNYYNGIVMRGYIDGIPESVLSGGRYDSLLSKMGVSGEAIGFAVFPDLIVGVGDAPRDYDVDAVLLYSEETDADALVAEVRRLGASGSSVRAEFGTSTATRCRAVYRMNGKVATPV